MFDARSIEIVRQALTSELLRQGGRPGAGEADGPVVIEGPVDTRQLAEAAVSSLARQMRAEIARSPGFDVALFDAVNEELLDRKPE